MTDEDRKQLERLRQKIERLTILRRRLAEANIPKAAMKVAQVVENMERRRPKS